MKSEDTDLRHGVSRTEHEVLDLVAAPRDGLITPIDLQQQLGRARDHLTNAGRSKNLATKRLNAIAAAAILIEVGEALICLPELGQA